jgi:hypothetical protein
MADVRYVLSLTGEQHEWLRQTAFDRRKSMAEIVRSILDRAMNRDYLAPRVSTTSPDSKRDAIAILRGEMVQIEQVRDRIQAEACEHGMADPETGLGGDYAVMEEALACLRSTRQERIWELEQDIRDLESNGGISPFDELQGGNPESSE